METNLACFPEDAVRVCKLSGAEVELKRSKLLRLQDCLNLLKQCEKDAKAARDDYDFYRIAELSARIVLVTCDVAMSFLEAATGPAGMVVGRAYSGGKLVVDAMTGSVDAKTGAMMLFENKATIAELATKMSGQDKYAKVIGHTKTLISLGSTIWGQVTGASEGSDGGEGIDSAIKTVQNQMSKIVYQIEVLETEIENC